jgi:hypothetical protein
MVQRLTLLAILLFPTAALVPTAALGQSVQIFQGNHAGSGTVVWRYPSHPGYGQILSCWHVVDTSDPVEVVIWNRQNGAGPRLTARVLAVEGESVRAVAKPLLYDGARLFLGAPAERIARWSDGGLAFVDAPQPGDHVSLHWDYVCDVLSPAAARALGRATGQALRAVNPVVARSGIGA